MLSGLLVAVAAPWLFVVFHRLQQAWLEQAAGAALDALPAHGLELQPTGFRSRLVARGPGSLEVSWRTGVLGPRTVVRRGDERRVLPLVRTPDELARALGGAAQASPGAV